MDQEEIDRLQRGPRDEQYKMEFQKQKRQLMETELESEYDKLSAAYEELKTNFTEVKNRNMTRANRLATVMARCEKALKWYDGRLECGIPNEVPYARDAIFHIEDIFKTAKGK